MDKKKWENYWYYYKIHTIAGVFVLILLIFTLKDCMGRIDPDLTVSVITSQYISDQSISSLKSELTEVIEDVNGDGKKELLILYINAPETPKSEQDFAISQKIFLEIAVGDSIIFVFNKGLFENYDRQESFDNITVKGKTATGFSLKGNTLLEKVQIVGDDLIIAKRLKRANEKKDVGRQFENVDKVLEYLTSFSPNTNPH